MLSSHKGVGLLTVKKIIETKDAYNSNKPKKVLYSAVVLDEKSKKALISKFSNKIPPGWDTFCHHMTIAFGKGLDDKTQVGKNVSLKVIGLGISEMAIAVKVEGYPSNNDIPHITVAVNTKKGGKPFLSNKITNWKKLDLGSSMTLNGTVTEIMN
jgi:hypothetical protein